MQRLRETLTLVLLALLPLHALLVTLGTKLILGPGFAPFSMLAAWKEGMLGLILVLALCEFLCAAFGRAQRPRMGAADFDVLDLCILGLIILGIITTLYHWPVSIGRTVLAIKYDFIPLIAFLVLRRVPWSDHFFEWAKKIIIAIGALVSAYGLLTLVLPDSFFRALGYSDAHSLYIVNKPLAAFQQIAESGVRRIQSTMSGPNQLGLWLLIPLGMYIVNIFHSDGYVTVAGKKIMSIGLLFILAALFFSYSRSAWIGAFFLTVTAIGLSLPRETFRKILMYGGIALIAIGIVGTVMFPKVFFRLSSSRGHIEHPIQAWHRMWASPLGEGLGAVGPASSRGSDTCVILRPQDDPSWAKSTPSLCVFLGEGHQVQPPPDAYTCKCPWHSENWYLQLGVEMGVIGFVLFVLMTIFIVKKIWISEQITVNREQLFTIHSSLFTSTLLAFIGISIGALFLHAWEDSAVAYSLWVLLATTLPVQRRV